MKWFPNTYDASEDMRRESIDPASRYDATLEKQRKHGSTRLSATFAEARPWNFMSSSQAPNLNNSSSRKRRSLFGGRTPTARSDRPLEFYESGSLSRVGSHITVAPGVHELGGSETTTPNAIGHNASRTPRSGLENLRSSLFSNRRRSTKLSHAGSDAAEPAPPYSNRNSRFRPSLDIRRNTNNSRSDAHQKINNISQPFNFQHITHTQRDQLAELDSVTDRELRYGASEMFVCQNPEYGPRGLAIRSDQRSPLQPISSLQSSGTSEARDPSQLDCSAVAGMSLNAADHGSNTPTTPSDGDTITPLSEVSRPLSQEGRSRSRSFTLNGLSSVERLATIGVDPRDLPAMVHPAFRPASAGGPVYELPAPGLHSVPEELEACSPPRPQRRIRLTREQSSGESLDVPATSTLAARHANFTAFPTGNAFAQACGGSGADLIPVPANDHTSLCGAESFPSLTSGESCWESEVDLLYMVEAESTCEFDWTSIRSSRNGSEGSQHRRDSEATCSTRTTSMLENTSSRPTSQRNSAKSYTDGSPAELDGISPTSILQATSKLEGTKPAARRRSATSLTNAALIPLSELRREAAVTSNASGFEGLSTAPSVKHARCASYSDQRPSAPKRMARWSVASPLYLPEDIRRLQPTFTTDLASSLDEHLFFTAPTSPPPTLPLPELPKQKPTGVISPPVTPPSLCSPEFNMVRRPSTPQDRALLQAAGRIVQRGRSARPATPSRLSHVQNAKDASPRAVTQAPPTPPKMDPVHFELSLFPTPPSSPPRQQQHEQYPAWI